jgi:nucleoredoxin
VVDGNSPAVVEVNVSALGLIDFVPEDTQLLDTLHGAARSRDVLKGKYVGIYFSARWCGPCRYFTPKLQAFRDANKENFEVVFISLDLDRNNRTPAGYLAKKKEYMESAKMDWYTIHRNYGSAHTLLKKTGKRGIPTLVVFSPEGKYITNDGTKYLRTPETALASWEAVAKGGVQ